MPHHPLALMRHPSTKEPDAPTWQKTYRGYFDGRYVKVTSDLRGNLSAWGRSPQGARGLAIRMERKSAELIEAQRAVQQNHLG